MVVEYENVEIENAFIGDHEMTLFRFSDDRLILWLELPDIKIIIAGFLDRDELLRIAKSMI